MAQKKPIKIVLRCNKYFLLSVLLLACHSKNENTDCIARAKGELEHSNYSDALACLDNCRASTDTLEDRVLLYRYLCFIKLNQYDSAIANINKCHERLSLLPNHKSDSSYREVVSFLNTISSEAEKYNNYQELSNFVDFFIPKMDSIERNLYFISNADAPSTYTVQVGTVHL